jgi:acyl carrier protein
MTARLQQVFRRVLRVDSIAPDSSPDTVPGWDSLAHLGLVTELEREFNVQFTPDEVISMVNVRIIVEILESHGALPGGT